MKSVKTGDGCWALSKHGNKTIRHRAIYINLDDNGFKIALITTEPNGWPVLFSINPSSEVASLLKIRTRSFVTLGYVDFMNLGGPFFDVPPRFVNDIQKAIKKQHLRLQGYSC